MDMNNCLDITELDQIYMNWEYHLETLVQMRIGLGETVLYMTIVYSELVLTMRLVRITPQWNILARAVVLNCFQMQKQLMGNLTGADTRRVQHKVYSDLITATDDCENLAPGQRATQFAFWQW